MDGKNLMNHIAKFIYALVFICWSFTSLAIAKLEESKPFLHPLFSDGMVIQQDQDVLIWGWAEAGTVVNVQLAAQSVHSKAGKDGKWQARLLPIASGNIYRLHISSNVEQVTISDVQIGEVWLCSGQSNMFWPVVDSDNAALALANADNPSLRLFNVDRHYATTEQSKFASYIPWKKANADTIRNFSAVCYYFGKKLQQELNVPVGLIHASWGGTKVEAWTDYKTLQGQKSFTKQLSHLDKYIEEPDKILENFKKQKITWLQQNDLGSLSNNRWSAFDLKMNDWQVMNIPGNWEAKELPHFDGIVWFRKSVFLNENESKSSYKLSLGKIDDEDVTWVNGVQIGASDGWDIQRLYKLPKGILKEGENVIAVRVFDKSGKGGFYSSADELFLINNTTSQRTSIAGDWNYKIGAISSDMTAQPQGLNKNTATVLYNAMIAPILPYQMRGAVWYQGESNESKPDLYQNQLTDMIKNWRERFEAPLAFHIVQLANYIPKKAIRKIKAWPKLREAQRLVAKQDPLVGIVSTIDIGNPNDIHPTNKLDVGKRLARSALNITYGKDIVPTGPEPIGAKKRLGNIVINYNNIAEALMLSKGDTLSGFEACTAVEICIHVRAHIDGKQVILTTDIPEKITSIKYGWADNPTINLINSLGLAAIPFNIKVE